MKIQKLSLTCAMLLVPLLAAAELKVAVSPPKITGSRAIVRLGLQNGFTDRIESARAAIFLLDEQGKMVAQASRWVIGGTKDKSGLAPGATNACDFVVASARPLATTNLTAKVLFSRVVFEGGKLADPRQVTVTPAEK